MNKHTLQASRLNSSKHLLTTAFLVSVATSAFATDGYFDHGYGVKSKGIGGAGVAYAQDALAPATNPAGAVYVKDSVEFGLSYFRPDRGATVGSAFGGGYRDANGEASFLIPDFGYKTTISPDLAFDLAIYGNGGMNTTYSTPIYGASNLSMNLEQLFVAPTLAYKVNDKHSVGISLNLAYQRFKATGLEGFYVSNAGYDSSYGVGFRIGYTGELADWLTVGATYQTRTRMTRFDKYATLFAENGDFDIPSNFALGFAAKITDGLVFVLDVERIRYSEVDSVGNPLSLSGGSGFGWRDVTAIKTGFSYDVSKDLTVRIGYNHSTQPIEADQTMYNVIAPGVVQGHLTLGATYRFSRQLEASAFYAHAFEKSVQGSGSLVPNSDANLRMKQNSFGLSVGWNF